MEDGGSKRSCTCRHQLARCRQPRHTTTTTLLIRDRTSTSVATQLTWVPVRAAPRLHLPIGVQLSARAKAHPLLGLLVPDASRLRHIS